MSTAPKPFKIHVTDEMLADLKERLARVRWPDEVPVTSTIGSTAPTCLT